MLMAPTLLSTVEEGEEGDMLMAPTLLSTVERE
jgi:hypothetical protein